MTTGDYAAPNRIPASVDTPRTDLGGTHGIHQRPHMLAPGAIYATPHRRNMGMDKETDHVDLGEGHTGQPWNPSDHDRMGKDGGRAHLGLKAELDTEGHLLIKGIYDVHTGFGNVGIYMQYNRITRGSWGIWSIFKYNIWMGSLPHFVWEPGLGRLYCQGYCTHVIDRLGCKDVRCYNLSTCGSQKPTKCPHMFELPPDGLVRIGPPKLLLHDVTMVSLEVTYNVTRLLAVLRSKCCDHSSAIIWSETRLQEAIDDYTYRIAPESKLYRRSKCSILGDIGGLFGSANSVMNSAQLAEANSYASWVAAEVGKGLQYGAYGTEYALTAINLQGERLV
ncbi:uncharacterized protein [Scyliorhinus torazame]|uniref:uncharacterized protein isoform X2 n=1 Tax=Scyliorhinus torazame TaxID=75743 RepID=UPI003B58CB14